MLNNLLSENKKKYQQYEFNDDLEVNLYESFYRTHDPQIGRFLQIDPRPNETESQFIAMSNNPISKVDVLGDTTNYYNAHTGKLLGTVYGKQNYGDVYINEDQYNKIRESNNSELAREIASATKGLSQKDADAKSKEITNKFDNSTESKLNSTGSLLDLKSDIGLLARIGFAEFRGSGSLEQQVGMDVTLNRVGYKEFGMSLEAVIMKRNAYSSIGDDNRGFFFTPYREINSNGKQSKANHKAWIRSVENAFGIINRVKSITQGATLYYSPMSMFPRGSAPKWDFRKLIEVNIYGVDPNHIKIYKYR